MAIKEFDEGEFREMMAGVKDEETFDRLKDAHRLICGGSLGWGQPLAETAFCPTYPNLRGLPSAQLALGLAKPVDLCPGMTAKEAHEALLSHSENKVGSIERQAIEWLFRGIEAFPRDQLTGVDGIMCMRNGSTLEFRSERGDYWNINPRDIPTARWFVAVLRDPERLSALLREREGRGTHGERYTYRLVERADEIDQRDLAEGESTGVVTAFERAAERMIEDHVAQYGDEPLAEPPEWWTPLPGARLLLTARELAIEGREMRHCVSGYAPYVKAGRSVIVALNIASKRSTVELDRSGRVRQHRGVRNEMPGKTSRDVMEMMRSAWGIAEMNEPASSRIGRAMAEPFQGVAERLAEIIGERPPQVRSGYRTAEQNAEAQRRSAERIAQIGSHHDIGHAPRDIAAGELMRVALPPVEGLPGSRHVVRVGGRNMGRMEGLREVRRLDPAVYQMVRQARRGRDWEQYLQDNEREILALRNEDPEPWDAPASTGDIMAALEAARDMMALNDTPFNPREVPSPFHSPDMPHYMANPLYRPGGVMDINMGQCVFVTPDGERHDVGNVTIHASINTEDA